MAVNPATITTGQSTTLSADVTDGLSGVAAVEYFTGADPGQGNGTAMTITKGHATATIGSGLSPGADTVSVRAQDKAGNWSNPVTIPLTVADPTQTGVSCSPNPAQAGSPATCTVTVTDTSSSPSTPAGTVSFTSTGPGSFSSGSCTPAGSGAQATCSVSYTQGT
jgi:hypothetical protein